MLSITRFLARKVPLKIPNLDALSYVRMTHSMSDPKYNIDAPPVAQHETANCEVLISTCRNIFYNLSFEDWLYENVDFSNKNLLLFWKSDPCIVIGRHQNPWAECNLPLCRELGIPISRRKSGGGTVYHDHGNLNCSFFTHRKKYDRKTNLEVISRALQQKWNLDVEINDRDDLVLNKEFKISGTAAKLGSKTAYHHCTILFDADTTKLSNILQTQLIGLQSKATPSVRSEVKNLCEVDPSITYNDLIAEIREQYLDHYSAQNSPVFIDPTKNKKYPGMNSIYRELRGWEWIYGKTPKFSLQRTFDGFPEADHDIGISLDINLVIEKGHISQIDLELKDYPENLLPHDMGSLCHILQNYWQGRRFWIEEHSTDAELPQINFALHKEESFLEPDSWGITKDLIKWMQKCIWSMLRL